MTERGTTPGDPGGRQPRQGARRSASANEARRREAARLAAMSATERALLALELGERYLAWGRRDGDR